MSADVAKVCGRCGLGRPEPDFRRDDARPDGLDAWCRTCRRAYMRAYYAQHAAERSGGRRLARRMPAVRAVLVAARGLR